MIYYLKKIIFYIYQKLMKGDSKKKIKSQCLPSVRVNKLSNHTG